MPAPLERPVALQYPHVCGADACKFPFLLEWQIVGKMPLGLAGHAEDGMESQGHGIGTPKAASIGNDAQVSCFIGTVSSLLCQLLYFRSGLKEMAAPWVAGA